VREPSPAPRPGVRLAAAVAGLGRPPAGLFARVRWLFLMLGLVTMAVVAVVAAEQQRRPASRGAGRGATASPTGGR
jgi:hypothetical protein